MKFVKYSLAPILLVVFVMACDALKNNQTEEFSFILAADWRYTATSDYDSPIYFRGALEAIQKVGKGAFMLSPGDVEPVEDSHNMITQVLGEDYPWYPIVGNHELEIPSTMDYLRELNAGGMSLPYTVNKGPEGCEETTYSFDYGNSHFVVLNQYYDGVSDEGTDGNVVDALYIWLENDLKSTDKTHIFVSGHEPIISIPDMDNGRHRHIGDSLDKYPRNSFRFHQLMREYDVTAYLQGHTHSTGYANINGLWQVDCGHARGTESEFPEKVIQDINKALAAAGNDSTQFMSVLKTYFDANPYEIKKVLYYMDLTDGISYKKLPDEAGFEVLPEFYHTAMSLGAAADEYFQAYYDNWSLARSTFMKFKVFENHINIDIYRNTRQNPSEYLITDTFQL